MVWGWLSDFLSLSRCVSLEEADESGANALRRDRRVLRGSA